MHYSILLSIQFLHLFLAMSQQCSVCLGEEVLELWTPSCGHSIHARCFLPYVRQHNFSDTARRCPTCRHELSDVELVELANFDSSPSLGGPLVVRCQFLEDCGTMLRTMMGYRCRVCQRESPWTAPLLMNDRPAPRCELHGTRTLRATWLLLSWHRAWIRRIGDVVEDCPEVDIENEDQPAVVEVERDDDNGTASMIIADEPVVPQLGQDGADVDMVVAQHEPDVVQQGDADTLVDDLDVERAMLLEAFGMNDAHPLQDLAEVWPEIFE